MAMNDGLLRGDDSTAALGEDELSQQEIVDLPNREAMSLIQPGLGLIEGDIVSPQGTSFDPMDVDPNQPPNLGMPTESDPTTAA